MDVHIKEPDRAYIVINNEDVYEVIDKLKLISGILRVACSQNRYIEEAMQKTALLFANDLMRIRHLKSSEAGR